MSETVDLTNCDREPIHISGAIQPHGVLLGFDEADGVVCLASANAPARLAKPTVIGSSLASLLGDVRAVGEALRRPSPRHGAPVRIEVAGTAWDGIVHRSSGVCVLELEPAGGAVTFAAFYERVRDAVTHLQTTTRLDALHQAAADAVRALTGFDRVMVYRFDRDWHGEVVAEAKREELEPFLGHHYPASDIPVQARRLYTLNWLRSIVDVDYVPVPLEPASTPSGAPLDLSFSTLRSVSPIHTEYLRNMGVKSSMSISLIRDGQLYGLVACHHGAPKLVPFEVRSACEFLGQTLSFQAEVRERATRAEHIAHAKEQEAALIGRLANESAFLDQLLDGDVLAIVEADGFAVRYDGQVRTFGVVPPVDVVERLCEWLGTTQTETVWATDRLGEVWDPGVGVAAAASGAMSVSLSRDQKAYLIWFKREVAQTVAWAGDPRKAARVVDGESRLSPRGSFALWVEETKGRSTPWADWQLELATHFRDILFDRIIRHVADLSRMNEQLKEAALAKDEFLAMVSHELRTPLSAITGFASLLAGGLDAERARRAVEVIQRAARTQIHLIDDLLDIARIVSGKLRLDVQTVDVAAVLAAALETVRHAADAKQIVLHVIVDPGAGLVFGDPARLQQVAWNLLANSVKFTPKGGRIHVSLRRLASAVAIAVTDNGIGIETSMLGTVFERFKQVEAGITRNNGGLGLGLAIAKHIVELHGGTIVARSEGLGCGTTFEVQVPIAAARRVDLDADVHATAPPRISLAGMAVLVVDDEPDGRQLLQEVFEQHDATVRMAGSAHEALQVLEDGRFDVVVSDIGMPGADGYELMSRIRQLPAARGGAVRAIALTAYARPEDRMRALRAGFQTHVAKPVDVAELVAVVASLLDRVTPRR